MISVCTCRSTSHVEADRSSLSSDVCARNRGRGGNGLAGRLSKAWREERGEGAYLDT